MPMNNSPAKRKGFYQECSAHGTASQRRARNDVNLLCVYSVAPQLIPARLIHHGYLQDFRSTKISNFFTRLRALPRVPEPAMPLSQLPPLVSALFYALAHCLDRRLQDRFPQVLIGVLFARGRRTVTAWFRAAD